MTEALPTGADARAARPSEWTAREALERHLRTVVERIAGGDPHALEHLFEATSRFALSLAERILQNPFVADEVLLDVYQYVWGHAATYDPDRGGVRSWILTITRSRALDRLRSRAARERREASFGETPPELEDPGAGFAPGEALISAERSDALERALSSLAPQSRRVLECAFFEGMSHESIAKALGQPLGTIKSQIRRALIKMQGQLAALEEEQ